MFTEIALDTKTHTGVGLASKPDHTKRTIQYRIHSAELKAGSSSYIK